MQELSTALGEDAKRESTKERRDYYINSPSGGIPPKEKDNYNFARAREENPIPVDPESDPVERRHALNRIFDCRLLRFIQIKIYVGQQCHLLNALDLIVRNGTHRSESIAAMASKTATAKERLYFRHRDALCAFLGIIT